MRILRKIKAFMMQTFVADCPKCHKHFYGGSHRLQIKVNGIHYRIVCDKCVPNTAVA